MPYDVCPSFLGPGYFPKYFVSKMDYETNSGLIKAIVPLALLRVKRY